MAKIKSEIKNISELIEYENNPRRNEKAIGSVVESIKKFGITNPILVNEDNVILAGHTRFKALKQMEETKVPCIVISELTEQQEKAFRIADNRTAELSSWDSELLIQEMKEISEDDWERFGFKKKDLEKLEPPEKCTCPKCGKSFLKV